MATIETAPAIANIAIQELPAQDYLGLRFTSALTSVGRDVQDGFRRLYAVIAEAHSRTTGPPFLIASEPKDGFMQIEVGAPCSPVPQPAEGLLVGRLEAGPAAVALHRGPYEQMGRVYAQIFQWIGRHGYRQGGAAREVYLNGPGELQSPDEYLTELVVPVQMSDRRATPGRRPTQRRGATPSEDARGREAHRGHDVPAGVQGPNFGYWQVTGATRSAAKRSKRP